MGVLYIKKKILAILMISLFIATVFGALTVSASVIQKQDNKPFLPTGFVETGTIAGFVFYIDIVETDDLPKTIVIEDATVYCEDMFSEIHEMIYEEIEPGYYYYVAYDVPAGACKITATSEGFSSKTIDAQVDPEGFNRYRIELDETPKPRYVLNNFLIRILQAFPILRLLIKI